MMRCTMCGREITNQDANYCDYCGTALGDAAYREAQPVQPATVTDAPKEDRVSTWLFLGAMLLMFVPVVGFFAHVGILLYWAVATSVVDSRKSFARAILIYEGATLVFTFTIMGAMLAAMT
ncbi:MAG: zinc ribbon domain-containing protein [Lachnospiraceae bacterium]|nr:zinc ribbon domain-containing protein [Lachnospiraceae bacterium]MBQ8547815.1 zinc ribbon domain-containing protein [Lachnospiraceae bacterium]MBQ8846517.1 zinc ribbon domain-containing protein [Lachnospiraceae bacterium]